VKPCSINQSLKLATYSSCEWEVLKRFTESEVKGRGYDQTSVHKYVNSVMAEPYI